MRQIILDTETTGLYPDQGHRIIEIGCVEMVNRKLTGAHFHQYINPNREIEAEAIAIHGITNDFLRDKPDFINIAKKFLDFVDGAELIIHNAPFDVGFINHEFNLLKKPLSPITQYCRIIDSLVLARQMHVGQRNSLDALCKRYFVDNSQREYHGALLDAHLLARVYLAMTGGQATLFGDASENKEKTAQENEDNILSADLRKWNIPVLKATNAEESAHENHLQQMAEKGKCLWLEEA
jgi:DNA polymerase-3 subunit epsilon